jgi:hypothetical protein
MQLTFIAICRETSAYYRESYSVTDFDEARNAQDEFYLKVDFDHWYREIEDDDLNQYDSIYEIEFD